MINYTKDFSRQSTDLQIDRSNKLRQIRKDSRVKKAELNLAKLEKANQESYMGTVKRVGKKVIPVGIAVGGLTAPTVGFLMNTRGESASDSIKYAAGAGMVPVVLSGGATLAIAAGKHLKKGPKRIIKAERKRDEALVRSGR